MGVVSNKVDITELKKGGGGTGDLPGRVTALEAESVELAEGLALVQTSVRSLDLESVQLAEGLARVQTSVNSGAVPMQTGDKIKFGVDGDGNYGYIKAGADTVTPFLTGGASKKSAYLTLQSTDTATLTYNDRPKYIFVNWINAPASVNTSNYYALLIIIVENNGTYEIDSAYRIRLTTASTILSASSYISVTEDPANNTITLKSSDITAVRFSGSYMAHLIS